MPATAELLVVSFTDPKLLLIVAKFFDISLSALSPIKKSASLNFCEISIKPDFIEFMSLAVATS